jgi:ketosteroid isomerase-like protein
MRTFLFFGLLLFSVTVFSQQSPDESIRNVLNQQVEAWNRGDIEAFMKGYWNSDSLTFIGSKGITYGFKNTWERYKKTYDSPEKMGTLRFELLHINPLAKDVYQVVGRWFLKRAAGDIGGYYTLLFRKVNGSWVIISDHTS